MLFLVETFLSAVNMLGTQLLFAILVLTVQFIEAMTGQPTIF